MAEPWSAVVSGPGRSWVQQVLKRFFLTGSQTAARNHGLLGRRLARMPADAQHRLQSASKAAPGNQGGASWRAVARAGNTGRWEPAITRWCGAVIRPQGRRQN